MVFTKIKLKNFKSLLDFEVEFNRNRKLILIYGENGVGKSNFIEAFNTLRKLVTVGSIDISEFLEHDEIKLNEDFSNIKSTDDENINYFKISNIKKIIESCKTLSSEGENMCLSFDFKLKTNKKGTYSIETDDCNIVSEKLEYVYNKEVVEFFNITNKGIFINKDVIKI